MIDPGHLVRNESYLLTFAIYTVSECSDNPIPVKLARTLDAHFQVTFSEAEMCLSPAQNISSQLIRTRNDQERNFLNDP